MQTLSARAVKGYAGAQRRVTDALTQEVEQFLSTLDFSTSTAVSESMAQLRQWVNVIANKYGNAAAKLAIDWFDMRAEMNGYTTVDDWMPQQIAYESTNGALQFAYASNMTKGKQDIEGFASRLSQELGRKVKAQSFDATMGKARRFNGNGSGTCEVAWVPTGAETCPYCLIIASYGFSSRSRDLSEYKKHVHSNCDCQLQVRFDGEYSVEGYDPDSMYERFKDIDEGITTEMARERFESMTEAQQNRFKSKNKVEALRQSMVRQEIASNPEWFMNG